MRGVARDEHAVDTADTLYRREYDPLVRLAFTIVGDNAAAEEIVQEAFARTVDRWRRIDNPGGYVRTCVVNLARKELRRRGRRAPPTAEPIADLRPRDEQVVRAVQALPPRRRAVVALRFYEDLTEAQIAETLGIRRGTVKATLHQALEQLRRTVGP
jgi:RNA polymerase sigma-70 factor (sigma-E family)